MRHRDAVSLIHSGVSTRGETWADLGAGGGTFTRALAEILGPDGTVHAFDREPHRNTSGAVDRPAFAEILPRQADFTEPLPYRDLDGILMANALHFVADAVAVLERILQSLRSGGTFLVVEYDIDQGSPWIPHPVSRARFDALAETVGLLDVREAGRTPSRYGSRDLYAVAGVKPPSC